MALITVEDIVRAGLTASYTNVAASHTFVNDGKDTFLHVVNGVTQMDLVIVSSSTDDGLAVADRTVTILANTDYFAGPWPTSTYGTTVTITFSETSDGTVAALKLPI